MNADVRGGDKQVKASCPPGCQLTKVLGLQAGLHPLTEEEQGRLCLEDIKTFCVTED